MQQQQPPTAPTEAGHHLEAEALPHYGPHMHSIATFGTFIFIHASYNYDSTGVNTMDVYYKCESENLHTSGLMIMSDH